MEFIYHGSISIYKFLCMYYVLVYIMMFILLVFCSSIAFHTQRDWEMKAAESVDDILENFLRSL